ASREGATDFPATVLSCRVRPRFTSRRLFLLTAHGIGVRTRPPPHADVIPGDPELCGRSQWVVPISSQRFQMAKACGLNSATRHHGWSSVRRSELTMREADEV